MAGSGRLGPRGGKRPSSSSYCTVTTVAFVAFFLLAVWVFSSSSFVHSSSRAGGAAVRSRASLSSSAYFRRSPPVLFKGSSEEGEKAGEEEAEEAVDEEPPVGVVSEGLEIRNEDNPGNEGREKESGLDQRKDEETQRRQQQEEEERHQRKQEEEEDQRHQQQQQEEQEQRHQQQQQEEQEQRHQQKQQEEQEQQHQQQWQQQEEEQRHQHQQQEEEQRHQEGEAEEEERRRQEQQREQGEDHVLSQEYQNSEEANGDLPVENEGKQSQETGTEQEERHLPDPTFDEEVNRDGHEKAGDEFVQREEDDPSETHDRKNGGEVGYAGGDTHHLLQDPYSAENRETELPSHQELKDPEEQEESPNKTEMEEEGREVVHLRREAEENVKDSQAAAEELTGEPEERKTPPWATQEDQSQDEKERQKELLRSQIKETKWELCNVTAGADYIPCLDNTEALRHIPTRHYEHRERHCPEESPTCLVPLPQGYRKPVEWPRSRDKIWYKNVPHTKLAVVKGHQNWMKVSGEYLTFPGGGTQFIHGALHYIDFIQRSVRNISWGKRTRVVLDVGCGVASFGGYLFERDVLTMSFAPKDEHEAQVQFALERGIPAISAVMGSQRLPFPSQVFDLIHCARCRVPWHAEGGVLLLELNRLLRPGGYFVWSATPVYLKLKDDVEIWRAMVALTKSMCWELVTIRKDRLNSVGAAFFRKPISNECYDSRQQKAPPLCREDDDPDVAWYVSLQSCMHRVPTEASQRGSRWPEEWPRRLRTPPHWLNSSKLGVYGKPAPDDFTADYEHWKRVVSRSYLAGLGIEWSKVRNAMDMRAVYGGFAAALRDLKIWVMNVVDVDAPETLPIIYERGLFGIYHDWCESFSTYPRTYDLLHADKLFSSLKERCNVIPVVAEVDRILRPGGKLIVRDEPKVVSEVEDVLRSLHWEVRLTFSKGQEGFLCAEKSDWRPPETLRSSS